MVGTSYKFPEQQLAIGIGCKLEYARKLIYADGFDLTDTSAITPIGVNCRLCMRMECNQRANPSLNCRVVFAENHRVLTPFTFAEL